MTWCYSVLKYNYLNEKLFLTVTWYRPNIDPVSTLCKSERVPSYLDKECKEIILKGDFRKALLDFLLIATPEINLTCTNYLVVKN